MVVDWSAFTPWTALLGGALIGGAAGILMLCNGRIAGISGVVGGLFKPVRGDVVWRLAFVAGLLCAPWLYLAWGAWPEVRVDASDGTLVAAGLLVGVGTRYGSGCTSGHGVCGISRWSVRSLVATVTFMVAGFMAVFVVRHLLA